MPRNESIEKLMIRVRRRQNEAEALAGKARDTLNRMSIQDLDKLNPDEIEGAADDLSANVRKLQFYEEMLAELRGLLM